MSGKKRLIAAAIVLILAGGLIFGVKRIQNASEENGGDGRTTLVLWYTDPALTDFLSREAVAYGKHAGNARVRPVLVSGVGFLEAVGEASAIGEDFPDLYITTHDNLEKAALAGLAVDVEKPGDVLRGDNYPAAALNAVSWHGRPIAYPFYGETTALLYNRTYLENEVRTAAEMDARPVPEGEEMEAAVQELIPETLEDLLAFAGNYNAPDEVEAVFQFHAGDLFTDYFFAGDAISVGGEAGDDSGVVDIYNEKALTCMDIFQQMSQFFAMDPDAVNEETILTDFLEGRIVFTISTTDAVRRIAEVEEGGDSLFEFGAAPLFRLTDDLDTRALSVTNCLVVNGFSEHVTEAGHFAKFLSESGTDGLYREAGKMTARYRADFGTDPAVQEMMQAYQRVYENSVPMPKMLETSNYWIRLEIAFADIWRGEEVNATMKRVAEQLMTQISGTETQLAPIADFPRVELSEELSEE